MSGESSETTYRFAPHPSAGFILGLRVAQLAGLIVAGALALASLRAGGLGALALALAVAGLVASVVIVPVRGQTLDQWTPVVARFLMGRRQSRFRAQAALVGHVVRLPSGDLDPQPVEPPHDRPSSSPISSCWSASSRRMTARCWAWRRTDARARTPRRFASRAARLSCCPRRSDSSAWRNTAACSRRSARDDSPLRRISWVERALPGDPDALGGYLLDAKRERRVAGAPAV